MQSFLRFMVAAAFSMASMSSLAALADFSDHYKGLLPPGFVMKDALADLDVKRLSQQRVALVVGHNFEAGVKFFNETSRFQAEVSQVLGMLKSLAEPRLQALQSGADSASPLLGDLLKEKFTVPVRAGNARGDPVMEASSPTRVVTHVIGFLGKVFAQIEMFPDLASARDSKADFIAVFDYGFIRHSMTEFSRVAKLDLLTPRIERVVAASAQYRPPDYEMRLFESQSASQARMVEFHTTATDTTLGVLKEDFVRQLQARGARR